MSTVGDSGNYRAIALGIIHGKIPDNVISDFTVIVSCPRPSPAVSTMYDIKEQDSRW